LYGQLSSAKAGNLFFSPTSNLTALAMTYAGAHGETAKEMAGVLRLSLPPDEVNSAYAPLLASRVQKHHFAKV
jgi:serpin B